MQFEEYEIVGIIPTTPEIFSLQVRPTDRRRKIMFKPGQFFHIKNPAYEKPNETRQFSAITTPGTKTYVEFTVRTYGPWTQSLLKKKAGESIFLFGPMGVFTFDEGIVNAVFIAGGVGIAPIISILASLHERQKQIRVTLIYATHSPETIIKNDLLEKLFGKNGSWKKSIIVSSIDGHITNEFLRKKIDFTEDLTFFVCGSQRFSNNIISLLHENKVSDDFIKQEVFLPPYPKKI